MSNKRSNRTKSRSRPRQNRSPQSISNMGQLLAVQRTQERSLPPAIVDVPKMILPRERLMMFERSFQGPNVVPSTTAAVTGNFALSLSLLPDYTEFTTLFDAYRIMQATVTFFPYVTMTNATTTSSLYTVIDYDDATPAPSVGAMLEYPSLMQSVAGSIVERTFSPYAANAAYSGTFTSYARMPRNTWVDAASPGVLYYGLKWLLDTNSNTTPLWSTTVRVVFQCKNVR